MSHDDAGRKNSTSSVKPGAEIPTFAVIGHPNEGKSSVVSTLAEDDSVRIGPIPGETVVCRSFPVVIDGKPIIIFVDTPGFQNPQKTLAWLEAYKGPADQMVRSFIDTHKEDPDFRDECELLKPVAQGAGIIYVVDGSRPLRRIDRIEMEILRITARPRMSIINCKAGETDWLDEWKTEFRRHFNANRVFNAHKATWSERIDLLESLKAVDQDWQSALNRVIEAFKSDWHHRTLLTAGLALEMLKEIFSLSVTADIGEKERLEPVQERLEEKFRNKVATIEKSTHQKIRRLYRHNIFNCELPPNSILHEALFSEKTWQFLGLSPKETAVAAGITGGATGAALDVAAAGLTFGIFTAIGSLAGAGYALYKGKSLADFKIKGIRLGRDQLRIGPLDNLPLMFVLLDRLLIFHGSVINWAHAKREMEIGMSEAVSLRLSRGVTVNWSEVDKKIARNYFEGLCRKIARKSDGISHEKEMEAVLVQALERGVG